MSGFTLYNQIDDIKSIFERNQCQRVFLVTGKSSYEQSGAKKALEFYLKDLDYVRYYDFSPNPQFKDLLKGGKQVVDFHPDIIVAIGGGSVLDTAKIISSLPPVSNRAKEVIMGASSIPKRSAKLVAIPTTAGSGSECTHFAAAYLSKVKYSVADQSLLPDYVILDPKLTWTMSPYLTAVSGMDALSQAIESYWAVNATKKSQGYAGKAIKTILEVFPKVVHNPTPELRNKMMYASHLAGKAINISKTTGPHAVSYILARLFNIPHGHAVALTLPHFFSYNLNEKTLFNSKYSKDQFVDTRKKILEMIVCKNEEEGREKLKSIISEAGLPTKLSTLRSSQKGFISEILKNVNYERLNNNPKTVSKDSLRLIIENTL